MQCGRLATRKMYARERLREPRSLLVRANPIDQASRLVGEICGAEPVPVSDGALMVAAGILRAGEINQKLVSSGIVVSELRPAGDSEKASSRN